MKYAAAVAIMISGLSVLCHGQTTELRDQSARIQALPVSLNSIPRAVFQQNAEFIIPELIVGGEWTSTIRLTNRGTTNITPRNVYFIDNNGNAMNATFQEVNCAASGCVPGNAITGPGFSFFLSPGIIVEATFLGGSSTQFGHAVVDICTNLPSCTSAGLYAEVTLRNSNSSRPDFESIFPLEQPTSLQNMLFDHRNGLTTVLYLVNENTTASTVSLIFNDPTNHLIGSTTVSLNSLQSQILTLNALVPATIGLQGTLIIQGQNTGAPASITATAIRINPTNSFTPIRAFVPSH
jgi:hypothetical protein